MALKSIGFGLGFKAPQWLFLYNCSVPKTADPVFPLPMVLSLSGCHFVNNKVELAQPISVSKRSG